MKLKSKFKFVRSFLMATLLMNGNGMAQEAPQNEVKAEVKTNSLILEARAIPVKPPLFFTASSEQIVNVSPESVRQTITIHYKKLQGDDEFMSLVLNDKCDIKSVTGAGLKEWSVRELEGIHYLDVRALDPKTKQLQVTLTAERLLDESLAKPSVPLMTLTTTESTGAGFSEAITIIPERVQINVTKALGCIAAEPSILDSLVFISNGTSDIELSILKHEGDYAGVDLRDISLAAVVDPDGKSALIKLTGNLHVRKLTDKPFTLVHGKVALSSFPVTDTGAGEIHVRRVGDNMNYGIICKQLGSYPIDLTFAVPITTGTGWNALQFTVPNGAVVPLSLSDLGENIEFRKDKVTYLDFNNTIWQGVLPATGVCALEWKTKPKTGDGELFYTSHGVSQISIGSGLMHTASTVTFKVLQGKMGKVEFDLTGAGEIVSVTGGQIASWKVKLDGKKKLLECILKSETSEVKYIRIASQFPLGKFPAKVQPLSLTPRETLRHSGFVRVSNQGSVRIETSLTEGLMQLSPDKFPHSGAVVPDRQVFVYRFPSAERKLEVTADQIISEVAVNHITTYEMSETDRVIQSDIEIDIAEAGLREWSFMIPADYSVSGVSSANMVDHVVSTTVVKGQRALKILFKKEVMGRQLIRVRLEKNLPASVGEWFLPALTFPDSNIKSIRGDIGILSANGWKVQPVATSVKNLDERPIAYFPKTNQLGERLQQAYRTRSGDWSVKLKITAKGQSIQSDLVHLYQLREGVLEANILAYYFVIGAPASEWKLELPATAENVSVEGQNVRTWHQNGDVLTVTLNQPVLGASKLLVSYEEPMDPRGGKISIGSVTPLNVQSESGFIHLVSSHQVKTSEVEKSENLLSISPLEMPSEHQVLTSIPSVAAWQYAARPFSLSLQIENLELVKSLDQAVGAASLSTRVTSAGEVVTNAKFLVNTRGKKALRIKLPDGDKLWTAKADGVPINARIDGEQLILPLPPTKDTNRYRTLEIRYGGMAENPENVKVGPPVLSAPLTIAEWKVTGDNHLTPTGGNVKPLQMPASNSKTGFAQLKKNSRLLAGVIFLLLGGIFLLRKDITDRWLILFGNLWLVATIIFCLIFGGQSLDTHVDSFKEFDVVAPVVTDQEMVTLELANHQSSPSSLSGFGIFLMLAGVGLLVAGLVKENLTTTLVRAIAIFAILIGCLMHVGGAAYFYFVIAIMAVLLLARGMPKLIKKWKFKAKKPAAVVSMILLSVMGLSSDARAVETIADTMLETWQINDGKLTSMLQISWDAEEGEALEILDAPAALISADGAGFRVIKVLDKLDKTLSWKLIAEETGMISAIVRYQVNIADQAELVCDVPSGGAAMKSLTVIIDQQNWQITSPQAVRHEKLLDVGNATSSTKLTLMGIGKATVFLKPMPRDRSKEKLRFLAEVADLYVPAPGVLDGRHKVKIKPLAGEVKELVVTIPDGLMVGDVTCSEIDIWRFDAKKKTLTITMKRPQTSDFELLIMTQRGVKAYPQDVVLESIIVQGAANTVGVIGYGFGKDSQPDNAKAVDLLEINIADFDAGLLKLAGELQPKFVLHKAFRHSGEGEKRGKINLKVAAVSPEIRVQSQQVIRLTDERMSLQVEALASITRAGVFELKFYVPKGLTVESINGSALRDWSVAEVKGRSLATMYLNGKTMGNQRFSITMLGDAPIVKTIFTDNKKWSVPRWLLENVSRQRGSLTLIPDHGIRLRVADRKHASQLDSKDIAEQNKGALAFRLLQKDWKISLAIQKLDPWVTAEILQQVSVREGLTNNWLKVHYHVEHAVVKQFQLRIPGVGKEQANTLRASGAAVKEIVHLRDDVWQVNLRRGMIGDVSVQVGYQSQAQRSGDTEVVAPVQLLEIKQSAHYIAVRAPSRLEVHGTELREWRSFDWANVPAKLYNLADRSEPSLCYRVVDVEKNMALTVKRHSMAGTLKLRVASGEMHTMFNSASQGGSALSRLSLNINVAEKSSLRVLLPEGAELFNVIVNDKSAEVVKEGDAYSFLVNEAIQENQPARVHITYLTSAGDRAGNPITLLGPTLSIPLENIDWYVMLPDGYDLANYRGSFHHQDTITNGDLGSYLDAFERIKKARYHKLRKEGKQELDRAVDFRNRGQLDKANAALKRVILNHAVDAASNEDARVMQEKIMTGQAIMGLNTRSQRSYMDNKAMGNTQYDNDALEEAVTRNPFFVGSKNFNPNQIGDYMQGNSDEEIRAMHRIARKLVKPQLVSSDAGQAVELEILKTQTVLHFHKDIHLAGESDLAIELELDQVAATGSSSGSNFGLILLLGLVSFLGLWLAKK